MTRPDTVAAAIAAVGIEKSIQGIIRVAPMPIVNNEENAPGKIEIHEERSRSTGVQLPVISRSWNKIWILQQQVTPSPSRQNLDNTAAGLFTKPAEEKLEKIQREKRGKMKIYMENPSSAEDRQFRLEQGTTSILSQQKYMDNFADERGKLVKDLEDGKAKLMRQRYEEEVKLEEEFDEEFARLIEKYRRTS